MGYVKKEKMKNITTAIFKYQIEALKYLEDKGMIESRSDGIRKSWKRGFNILNNKLTMMDEVNWDREANKLDIITVNIDKRVLKSFDEKVKGKYFNSRSSMIRGDLDSFIILKLAEFHAYQEAEIQAFLDESHKASQKQPKMIKEQNEIKIPNGDGTYQTYYRKDREISTMH